MTLLINSQNKNPLSLSIPGETPTPALTLSSEDFIAKAICIVKTKAQTGTVEQIGSFLQKLMGEYDEEALTPASYCALIEGIKGVDVCAQHLPTIYRYLLSDLPIMVDDLSRCNEEFRIAKARSETAYHC